MAGWVLAVTGVVMAVAVILVHLIARPGVDKRDDHDWSEPIYWQGLLFRFHRDASGYVMPGAGVGEYQECLKCGKRRKADGDMGLVFMDYSSDECPSVLPANLRKEQQ